MQSQPSGNWSQRRAHKGYVLGYLFTLVVFYTLTLIFNVYAMTDEQTAQRLRVVLKVPDAAMALVTICAAVDLLWIVAIFFWQRLGFYGFLVTSVVMFLGHLQVKTPVGQAVLALVPVAILFFLLQLGTPRSTWSQMR